MGGRGGSRRQARGTLAEEAAPVLGFAGLAGGGIRAGPRRPAQAGLPVALSGRRR